MKNYTELIKDLNKKCDELKGGLIQGVYLIQLRKKNIDEFEKAKIKNKATQEEVKQLEKKIRVFSICKDIEENNQRYDFMANTIDTITNIINKYKNKRIGEKTYSKMVEEIKNISNEIRYVRVDTEYKNITIHFNNLKEIYLSPKNYEVWFGSDENIELFHNVDYVDYDNDIEMYAEKLIKEEEKLLNLKEEVRKRINDFNSTVSWTNLIKIN